MPIEACIKRASGSHAYPRLSMDCETTRGEDTPIPHLRNASSIAICQSDLVRYMRAFGFRTAMTGLDSTPRVSVPFEVVRRIQTQIWSDLNL